MIKAGGFVRCPIDREYPQTPRMFATGKVVSVNDFIESAHIEFADPFGYRKFFEFIPTEVEEAPLRALERCHLFKGTIVWYGKRVATVVEYKRNESGVYEYYIQDNASKEYFRAEEGELTASFLSGCANPVHQLKKYEFQNPCWYLGRQIVKDTMNILDNAICGFRELAGCKIYLKAFQLNTIMRCVQSEKCRFMLADEVGLGKTIEACSILKIFLTDKAEKKIVIVVPRSLTAQWKTELLFKFGIMEGKNKNGNCVYIYSAEELSDCECGDNWDFVIVDEVHNYLKERTIYEKIHNLSVNAENIILLSATPIQQRKEEYLDLLKLILPQQYDHMGVDQFEELVEKQNNIARTAYLLLDQLDSFKNELLPDVEEEDAHDNEDVREELEGINENLRNLAEMIGDEKLSQIIAGIDNAKEDFGMYEVQVAISYVCDNYQMERNIIRGRRALLGVHSQNKEGEFAERKLEEITYSFGEEDNYYESEAYRTLKEWLVLQQETLDTVRIEREIRPVLEAFFSSPWAYVARLEKVYGKSALPDDVWKSASRWLEDENEAIEQLADIMDDVQVHPSRLMKLISYIDIHLYGKKVVIFTDQAETFHIYYDVLREAFGEEVTGFAKFLDRDEAEKNIYRFQSVAECRILICDQTGGEGRNLQIADYVVHIDLPWNINVIEQRIGRLDRMGRNVEVPVTSIVIHTTSSYEEQLFDFWNKGLNVFKQSLSGLEIIMNDINRKIVESIKTDFEYGLYRLIPELIEEAEEIRETVRREQIFDTTALRFRPMYIQLEKLLADYQSKENTIFAETMMSWASLAGFGKLMQDKSGQLFFFEKSNFSTRSAQNSFLIPPNWNDFLSRKHNELMLRVQRGEKSGKAGTIAYGNGIITYESGVIKGTFERDIAIKNDYIHFYAPGDEIFDSIVNNALCSYRGMCTAFAAESAFDWMGFIYTYSIEPNERLLLEEGVDLHMLGLFRQYLASTIQVVPVAFSAYGDVPEKQVLSEHRRISQMGYFNRSDTIEHLGRRGREDGFLKISTKYCASNLDWFKSQYDEDRWERLVDQSSKMARKKARERFAKASDLAGVREMMEQILSAKESREKYFGACNEESAEQLKRQHSIIYESLSKPVIRLESACYMWLIKR